MKVRLEDNDLPDGAVVSPLNGPTAAAVYVAAAAQADGSTTTRPRAIRSRFRSTCVYEYGGATCSLSV
jgi:hypothetical protein